MKNKKILLFSILLVIAVVGIVVFFILRPQPEELSPQKFAELPEKPKLISEFQHGATVIPETDVPEGFSVEDAKPIFSVAFSPIDASLIASVNTGGIIKLWNKNDTKEPVKVFNHHGQGYLVLGILVVFYHKR